MRGSTMRLGMDRGYGTNSAPRRRLGAMAFAAAVCLAALPPGAASWADGAEIETDRAPSRSVDDATLERLLKLHYTQSEKVRLVLLPTSVTDRRGRAVRGLEPDDFRVFEDHVPQEIKFFSSEASEPVSLAFLLDVSGSMRQLGKLRHAKEAIRYVVDHLGPEDRFGLICFADEQVSWVTDFTQDRERFLARLEVQEAYGQTALNDAVAAAPRLVNESVKGRKAIVLITDGVDNTSQLTTSQAVDLARQISLPIYTIGFLSVPEENLPKGAAETNLEILRSVAGETGGRLFSVHDVVELKEAVAYLEAELRHQYLIGYYPTRKRDDGEFHKIRMEVGKSRWQVRTRAGYYATP